MKIILFLIFTQIYLVYSDNRIVRVSNGLVRGFYSKNYIAFKGIPFAEKPIGEKRFEPVQLFNENWDGIRNATEFGPMCIQNSPMPDSNGEPVRGNVFHQLFYLKKNNHKNNFQEVKIAYILMFT